MLSQNIKLLLLKSVTTSVASISKGEGRIGASK
jgi:hypothetical protein